jgi:hypothetical protein
LPEVSRIGVPASSASPAQIQFNLTTNGKRIRARAAWCICTTAHLQARTPDAENERKDNEQ